MKYLLVFIFLLLLTTNLFSQYNKLSITYFRDLNFGDILPGVPNKVSETESSAGKFSIRSTSKSLIEVSITFNLPRGLVSGSNIIPVDFSATKSQNNNDIVPGESFNPYQGTNVIFDEKREYHYIRIGGIASPSPIQYSGNYSSSIIIILTIVNN